MRKFGGVFEYSWIEQTKENQFTLTFNHVFLDEDQAQSVVKHESASEQ
jgi:hypothetical protein